MNEPVPEPEPGFVNVPEPVPVPGLENVPATGPQRTVVTPGSGTGSGTFTGEAHNALW